MKKAQINVELIKNFIKSCNLTEEEFCKKYNIKKTTLDLIFNQELCLITMFKLASIMQIDPTELVIQD